MVKRISNAKIACLDFNLQKTKMKLGVQIVVDDPNKLDAIRERLKCFLKFIWLLVCQIISVWFYRESDITKERIMKILNAGANVILTTGGIDDLNLKYFIEAGAMAVRRCKKIDLKRIAKATGGKKFFFRLLHETKLIEFCFLKLYCCQRWQTWKEMNRLT
jgi:T-complex protein 1 subunit alpha